MKYWKVIPIVLLVALIIFPASLPAQQVDSAGRTSVMHLKIGSSSMDLNGITRQMDVAPFIENSRTWVPVRFVSENLAASVDWSATDQKVTITQVDQTLNMVVGNPEIMVNGQSEIIDVSPFIRDSRTWVPVRFVSENLGAEVGWDEGAQEVTITFPGEIGVFTKVTDGDTIRVELSDGNWPVRFIGINTTEVGQPYSAEGTAKMNSLVSQKTVLMQKDVNETDQYNRLLRYVYVGSLFVNAEMVRSGWAEAVDYPPDVKYSSLFHQLETEAKANQLGQWSGAVTSPTPTPLPTPSVSPPPSPTPTPSPTSTPGNNYVGNSNTKKFHKPSCSSVADISPEHKVYFSTREQAINAGYVPCKRCNP